MYQFRLLRSDGSPFDPPTYRCTTLGWRQGDKIPLHPDRTLRVLGVRDDDADQPPSEATYTFASSSALWC